MQSLLEKDKYSVGIGAWNYPYGETDVQVIFLVGYLVANFLSYLDSNFILPTFVVL